ncbi:hypothetical protein KR059_009756, partial [Drosophila kikkawai]
ILLQNDATISFLRAARSGDLQKVLDFLESEEVKDINSCNANGLNALHLAAKDGYVDICCELLRRGIKVDNATKKGNTALHIASLAGQQDVIHQLLLSDANVNVQSLNGFTPLYMAAQENHDNCCRLLLANGANPSLATEDGFTPLAVAMQQGHDKIVAVLLENDIRGKVRLPAMHIAAKKNDVKAATLLLQNDNNPDTVSKSGFTPLHIAAHYGNVDIATLLLDNSADVNYVAKHQISPLHVACKWGKVQVCQLLLSRGAKIDAATRDGLTPLHCASRSGHVEVIELLLSQNAPILTKTKNGLSALHMSAQGEHNEAARLLLDNKAPVDEVTIDYLTALHVAAHCGHVKVAKLLLDYGANPNARALNGFTPLHIACKKNRIKIVELLIKHGANIGATTESGLTPLHVASFMGCMNIVIYLMQHDANPDVPTLRGETALHLATRASQTDIIRILLRNGSQVNSIAREGQTPLHVASRLGNINIIMLLLQHGAQINAETKDKYTPLHIAAKEGHDEDLIQLLLENGAHIDAVTKKGFSPLHLASKYGKEKIVSLLLDKGASIDSLGKNDVSPLLVATHYNHQAVVELLLKKGASAKLCARNGQSALHIAAKKNNMEVAQLLLQNGADVDSMSRSGFSPLHLASQEGHIDMVQLLLEYNAKNNAAKNGLVPLHLASQEGHVHVARLLLDHGSPISQRTKNGYSPLHIAAHYGHLNLVKFLLENDADIEITTNTGFTPLHQAAQQGHVLIINLLLRHKANPEALTNTGKTPLHIASNLGYVTAIETLKIVTKTSIVDVNTGVIEEKFKVLSPEIMHETLLSDSEDDDAGDDDFLDHNHYKYMETDDLKANCVGADQRNFDTTNPDQHDNFNIKYLILFCTETIQLQLQNIKGSENRRKLDNVPIVRPPIHLGFLVSFLVDARGGSMRGYRHSGVRIIVPPKACSEPTRITCRYVKPQRIANLPPLMEGEALVSRILEMTPVEGKFLSPITLEVPHFGTLRENEREIIILRSDNGESWREHYLYESEDENKLFNDTIDKPIEDLATNHIVRIVTQNVPHFFAVVSRVRQEVHAIGPDGGTVYSTAVPEVQATFPRHALTKKIRVGLQAQPIDLVGCSKLLGHGVAVSPVVTVEPRRRKFHKAITLSIPAPKASSSGMVNACFSDANASNPPTLRLLCSITGGQSRAAWEDVTGSTPLSFVKDRITFTTTVSARFWLMDCRNISDASRMATELYTHLAKVPFIVKFVVFAKRISQTEAKFSVFCMTDDKEEKTLEQQEYFTEIAKSRNIEVLQDQIIYLEFNGNFVPVLKTDEQLSIKFEAFCENRLSFIAHVKDPEMPQGRINFMSEPKAKPDEAPLNPICSLSVALDMESLTKIMSLEKPENQQNNFNNSGIRTTNDTEITTKNEILIENNIECGKVKEITENSTVDIRLIDICRYIGEDWPQLAMELDVPEADIELVKAEYSGEDFARQGIIMLQIWLERRGGSAAEGNVLAEALYKIHRADIVQK